MAAVRVFAFLLLVAFAVQLVAPGVVRPSEASAQSTNAADEFLEAFFALGARRRNQTAGRNDTDPSGGNILQLVETLNNKMMALVETTRCHNSTEECDVFAEAGEIIGQRLLASLLRSHPHNASARHLVAREFAAEVENLRRVQQRLHASQARVEQFPQNVVSLDTR